MKSKNLCILCHVNEAVVPDRDKPMSRKKEICRSCHGARLQGDLKRILDYYDKLKH